ncbi:hypothetical protein ACFQ0B_04155 [Nonomuraea thailandensis]
MFHRAVVVVLRVGCGAVVVVQQCGFRTGEPSARAEAPGDQPFSSAQRAMLGPLE